MSDFWTKKLAGMATPPAPAQPAQSQGAWWQDAQPQQQVQQGLQYAQHQYGHPDPALQAQMPYGGPTGPQGMPEEQHIKQLMRTPADQLTQDQMELIAQWELANKEKYNQVCPQCGSANFAPAGMKIGTTRMPTDKCFECGASSSTFTSSPEPALGGRSSSSAPYRDVRQIDTGGGAGSMYMKFRGMPGNYVPTPGRG